MPLLAAGSPLVAGSGGAPTMPTPTKHIRALRAFRLGDGRIAAIGAVYEVDLNLAREVVASNKGVIFEPPAPEPVPEPAPEAPPVEDSAPDVGSRRRRKE